MSIDQVPPAVFEPVTAPEEEAQPGGTVALPLRDLLPGASLPPQPALEQAAVLTPPLPI